MKIIAALIAIVCVAFCLAVVIGSQGDGRSFRREAIRVIVVIIVIVFSALLIGFTLACDPGDQWYVDADPNSPTYGELVEGTPTVVLRWSAATSEYGVDGYVLFVERRGTWEEVARLSCRDGTCPGVDTPVAPVKYYDPVSGLPLRYCVKAFNAYGDSTQCSNAVSVCEPLLLQEIEP